MPRHVTYDEYLTAVALTLRRRHRPAWSVDRKRIVCRCGSELPCSGRHRVPINRGHWPGEGR
ncbi:hypothetical protein OG271_07790 [Micromonospora rifamycinica]|uniref:hypothetical protein n=1 Tax=Micromonospora rifamycinica TaxID=291594 RepID=UPI002E29450E|nr:hypothetical protein [Micromonospora rifamycinica]